MEQKRGPAVLFLSPFCSGSANYLCGCVNCTPEVIVILANGSLRRFHSNDRSAHPL